MQVELLGIWHGLQMAKDISMDRVIIEADSSSVLHFLDGDYDLLHPCAPIVHDIKSIISQFACVE